MWKQRTNVAHELEATEKTYLQKLHVLINVFLVPLRKSADHDSNPLASRDQIRAIFGVIEDIAKLNSEIVAEMETRISYWSYSQKLGDIFNNKVCRSGDCNRSVDPLFQAVPGLCVAVYKLIGCTPSNTE